MGKKELKKQYKKYDFSVIDFISKFDTSKNNKLTPFLMKMFEESCGQKTDQLKPPTRELPMAERLTKPQNRWEEIFTVMVGDDFLGGNNNLELLESFNKHLSEGRIDDTDINNYNSWSDIFGAVCRAETKYIDKKMEKEIKVIHQDDEWLFLKPLSLKASQKYGMGTKWCTSMKHEAEYFYRYSIEGILVYAINKNSGRKFGFYSSEREFSVWDEKNNRIDSLETYIPTQLLYLIRDSLDLKNNPKNIELFSEEESSNSNRFYGEKTMAVNAPVMEEPMAVGPIEGDYAETPMAVGPTEGYGREYMPEPNNYMEETTQNGY